MVAFAAKRFVEEAVVAKKLVEVAFVVVLLVISTLANTPFVPMRFVVVTVPKLPFQRSEGVPSEKARSVVGVRLDETVPDTVSVEVTVALFVANPPSNERVAVAIEPRFVTERSVSASAG